jgi:hypothetical protein
MFTNFIKHKGTYHKNHKIKDTFFCVQCYLRVHLEKGTDIRNFVLQFGFLCGFYCPFSIWQREVVCGKFFVSSFSPFFTIFYYVAFFWWKIWFDYWVAKCPFHQSFSIQISRLIENIFCIILRFSTWRGEKFITETSTEF